MKKYFYFSTVITAIVIFIFGMALIPQSDLHANSTGAPAQRTGSPGDTKSCTTCHTGIAQNVSGIITINVPLNGYIPGSTYIIEAVCVDATKNRFGFEISPQNVSGAKLGVLTITDATRTKLVGSGKYITHTAAGTTGQGMISWSFNWTAPPAGTGDVTFYGAFNYTNHNNAASGDLIKLSELLIREDVTTTVETIPVVSSISVFPNPVKDIAHVMLPLSPEPIRVHVFDASGAEVRNIICESQTTFLDLDLTNLPAGTFYLSFTSEKVNYSTKLIKL